MYGMFLGIEVSGETAAYVKSRLANSIWVVGSHSGFPSMPACLPPLLFQENEEEGQKTRENEEGESAH